MTAVTSVAAFAAVLLGLLTAVLGFMNQRKINASSAKVDRISVDVDGRLSLFIARQVQLLDALQQAGVPVPDMPGEGPATVETMTDTDTDTEFAAHAAALTTFFGDTLPAAVLVIEALKRQGITNLDALDDLIEAIPGAIGSFEAILKSAPTPAAAAAPTSTAPTSATGMPGEQMLPDQ